MKRLLVMSCLVSAAIFAAGALTACATVPNDKTVTAIQNACAVDAGLRPIVAVLLATPGVAQPEDVAAITAARAVIDPICANPSGPVQANAIAALTGATAQIVAITAKLQK